MSASWRKLIGARLTLAVSLLRLENAARHVNRIARLDRHILVRVLPDLVDVKRFLAFAAGDLDLVSVGEVGKPAGCIDGLQETHVFGPVIPARGADLAAHI